MTQITVVETTRRKPRKTLQRKYPTGGTKNAGNQKIAGKKPKEKSISKLIEQLDALFSYKTRQLDREGAELPCFTCGRFYGKRKLQCGHYLSRFYKAARWDKDNARPQCMMCNLWKRGDPIVFRQNLVKEIGLERVEAVEAKRNISIKLTREYLAALLVDLTSQKIDK